MTSHNAIGKIMIYFCIPDYLLKRIIVPKTVQVNSILKIFNENCKDYLYIYNGKIIDPDMTFDQIKIMNQEVIVASKKDKKNEVVFNQNLSLKIKQLRDDQLFEKKLKLLADKNFKMENCRLIDAKYRRIEGNCKLFRKKEKKFLEQKNQINDNQFVFDLNLNYQPLIEPCDEAMPILW